MKYLDRFANFAIILLAVVATTVFVRSTVPQPSARAARRVAAQQLAGKKIELPGAALSEAGVKKVVLSISTTCHFCEESTPFFRKLSEARANGTRFKLVAALPQDAAEAESYLQKREFSVDAVVSSQPLAAVGVHATPTLLIIGGDGRVEQVWVGLLNETRQKEVLSSLKVGTL